MPLHDPRPVVEEESVPTALVVDDERPMRELLSRALEGWGYQVESAESGDAALAAIRRRRVALMLCDQRMPGLSGVETVSAARAIDPDLAIVVVTGVHDIHVATEAMRRGAADLLTKPFELETLRATAERALRERRLRVQQRRFEARIRDEVELRTRELELERHALRSLTLGVAETLINAMEAKDLYLRGHSQRVAHLAASVASHMGHDDDTVEQIRLAGRLHDVGKIGIRESVLNKPGKLTPEEYEHVKDHVRIGVEILAPLEQLGTALEYVHDHHEHWDGSGYPRGLAGDAISVGGRILCAADTFDALTSRRAYREPMTVEATIELMRSFAGTQLDVEAFAALTDVVLSRQALPFLHEAHGPRLP